MVVDSLDVVVPLEQQFVQTHHLQRLTGFEKVQLRHFPKSWLTASSLASLVELWVTRANESERSVVRWVKVVVVSVV